MYFALMTQVTVYDLLLHTREHLVSALNFKWATRFYLSIRSLLELRLHPVPNWGQARLMRLGQIGMSVKLLSLGKGLVQGHYSAREVGKARRC